MSDIPSNQQTTPQTATEVRLAEQAIEAATRAGVKAFIFLQGLNGITATEQEAREAWVNMSSFGRMRTMQYYTRCFAHSIDQPELEALKDLIREYLRLLNLCAFGVAEPPEIKTVEAFVKRMDPAWVLKRTY